jgi:PAS domain S-box-containing protein
MALEEYPKLNDRRSIVGNRFIRCFGMKSTKQAVPGSNLKNILLWTAVLWSALILGLATGDQWDAYITAVDGVRDTARESFSKDLVYRRWAAMHGGVYAPITAETPPNPNLADIPERDISTPSGRKLTLINPAYMTRQVHELGQKDFGSKGHITSLNPIRPENAPDEWERRALQAFERGEKEVSSIEPIGSEMYFRLMRPLIADQPCLKCHEKQGYKVGDIRGGLSVSISWAHYREDLWKQLFVHLSIFGAIWVIGLLGLRYAGKRIQAHLSERTQAENLTRASEARYRAVSESASDAIVTADSTGRIINWNRGAETIFGYTEAEAMVMPLTALVPQSYRDRHRSGFSHLMSGGQPHTAGKTIELAGLHKDGREFPIEASLSHWDVTEGRFVTGIIRDITERKQREEVDAFLSLAGSRSTDEPFFEALARFLAQSLQMDYVCIDILEGDGLTARTLAVWHDGHFEDNVTYALKDTPCGDVVGQQVCCFPASVAQFFPRDQALQELRAESYIGITLWSHTGEPIGLIAVIGRRPLTNRSQAEAAMERIGVRAASELERLIDETKIRKLNADLEQRVLARTAELEVANQALTVAKSQAEAASVTKSDFLANMSHEIRTPMNGILGMANILRREGVTPKQAQRLDTIDTSAQHLLSIINNILDISKIEAGKFVLEEAPVVVSSLLANVSSILSDRAKDKGITFLIEAASLPHNLVGDPTRLQQALINYVINAIKFTEKGTVALRSLKQEENTDSVMVRFEVQDTGIGISSEAMSRLFSAFEQADSSMTRKYGGTGLGLAITRRLAKLMGGEAGADSTLEVGSTFWFTVKLKKGDEAAIAPATTAVDSEAEIRRCYAGQRVLVVDDEPVNREIALMQLEYVDLVVDTAEDGAEAVAMARKTEYAAIFMDMQMPKLNGLEATQDIRRLPGYRDIPIIAMTANAFAEDKAKCMAAGMNDFLIKPFNPGQLFAVLLRALNQRDV